MSDIQLSNGDQSPFDAIRRVTPEGREFWSARELMPLLGYERWERFADAIDRAKIAAHNSGSSVAQNFPASAKVSGTRGPAQADYHLSRYACYLTAMSGDARKPEVAAALTYFAIKTREAETRPQALALPGRRELALMVIEAEDRADAAESQVKELTAPARSWQLLADAHGDFSVAEAAKILNRDGAISTGRGRLFDFMADQKWIFKSSNHRGGWEPYQTAVDTGRLTQRINRPFLNSKTGAYELPAPTIRVTAKGIGKLHELMGGTEPIRFVVGEAS